MRTTPRRAALVFVALAVPLLSACVPPPPTEVPAPRATTPTPTTTPRPAGRVVVYGDSLVAESRVVAGDRLRAALPGWEVTVRAFPGTAQCDWHDEMEADAHALRPDVVVIAFSGNRLSTCIIEDDQGGERPFPEAYGQDAEWAADLWAEVGVPVAFVGTPPAVGTSEKGVQELYDAVARQVDVPFLSADRLFVDPATGLAEMHLGCLPEEGDGEGCEGGSIRVRHLDGRHLCTVPVVLQACPVYASGVTRYAAVLAEAAAAAVGIEIARLPDATSTPEPEPRPEPAAP